MPTHSFQGLNINIIVFTVKQYAKYLPKFPANVFLHYKYNYANSIYICNICSEVNDKIQQLK